METQDSYNIDRLFGENLEPTNKQDKVLSSNLGNKVENVSTNESDNDSVITVIESKSKETENRDKKDYNN